MKTLRHFVLMVVMMMGVAFQSFAQQKYTVSGTIKDVANGEVLIGATAIVKDSKGVGTATNVYGFYSLTLPQGTYTIEYSFIGYQTVTRTVELTSNQTINVEVGEGANQLQEIEITGDRPDKNVEDVKMSVAQLPMAKVKLMPALLGEVDVIKTLALLPGIQTAGEGTTGLFVRGGANDQNLILLDDAPVYNASHLLGFFSVFNPDAIKDLQIYKAGIPAQYGGRLSSIIDIRMNEGNSKNFQATGGIGSISSRLTLEAPIVKDKGSFIISGRRTYADVFLRASSDPRINQNTLYFYDFNAKVNYKLSDKDRIFISGYFGRDVFKFSNSFGMDWGNATGTVRWNHVFNRRLFLNTTAIFSNFDYGFRVNQGVQNFNWTANLQQGAANLDFSYYLNPDNTISFGMHNIVHRFSPANISSLDDKSIFANFNLDKKYALEQALYLSNEQRFNDRLTVQYGLRYSLFQNIGPGQDFLYRENEELKENNIVDSVKYKRFELANLYHGLEPRLGIKYSLNTQSSLKASYNRTRQYLQVASNSTASLPFDRWVPAGRHIKPQIGDQVAMGYFRNFKDNAYELSTEVYYKWMQNQIDIKNGADIALNNRIETALLAGKGWSYGLELMLKKNAGKTTGWVSYTLSKTQRQIEGINGGKAYSPRYDRRHNASVVVSHAFSDRITLSGTWVYSTGFAVSFPIAKYEFEGKVVDFYDDLNRNGDRLPDYHRLDLSLNIEGKNKKSRNWQGSWNFSLYNAYGRRNTFTIDFRESKTEPGRFEAVRTSLFGIIPSVTYNFKFINRKVTAQQ